MRARVLLVGVAASVALWALAPAGVTGSTLTTLQDKIQITQGLIGRKKGTERVLTTQITAYNRRIRSLQGKIGTLGARQGALEADLDAKRASLGRTQARLRSERARLARLRRRAVVAQRTLAERLVQIYQADRPDIVTVVLNSDGFADLLEREEFIRRISNQDRKIVALVRAAKADATAAERGLSTLERRQQTIAAAVLRRRDEIAGVRGELIDTRVGYQRTRAGKAQALAKTRERRQVLEGRLDDYKAQQARIAAAVNGVRALPAGEIRQGSGQLVWPVNGPITSPFCERRAWEACHPGIDIGVPAGTPIRAAAAGTVALVQSAGVSGGYGNFTCVAHTSSLSTCYAHQSVIQVSTGQQVAQGQVIGLIGCTGRCYGDHLHFEVRVNGAVTNPMAYL